MKAKFLVEKLLHLLDKYDAIGHLTKIKHIHERYSRPTDINITLNEQISEPISETLPSTQVLSFFLIRYVFLLICFFVYISEMHSCGESYKIRWCETVGLWE